VDAEKLVFVSKSANACFEDVPATAKHCLIHPFKREKYLEQS